jgi:transposase InsO family protein
MYINGTARSLMIPDVHLFPVFPLIPWNYRVSIRIKHIKSEPYHPATNGLAERFIQTFKNSMRAMKDENRDINQKIANCLLM